MERYRTTLLMLGALAVLVVAWLFLRNGNSAAPTATPTVVPQQYVWQETGTASAIDVVSGTTTVSVRQDLSTTVWTLVAPVKGAADVFQVNSVAESLKNLQATALITGTQDLAQFGLATPAFRVEFKTAGASTSSHSLEVGNMTIDSAGYYVRADGKTVAVVPGTAIESLRGWITKPPLAPPTPTAQPVTPTTEAVPSVTVGASGTVTLTLPSATTTGITGTESITTTVPGAPNATTPVAETPIASPTK